RGHTPTAGVNSRAHLRPLRGRCVAPLQPGKNGWTSSPPLFEKRRPMIRIPSIALAALLGAIAASAWGQPAPEVSQRDRDRARLLFERGVAAASAGEFAAAIGSFRASYDLNPRPVVLVNIGSCLQQLGDLRGAVEAFRRYLDEAGEGASAERRAQVEAQIREIERGLTFLHVQVDQQDAAVLVEGRPVGASPLPEPVRVAPGMVEVRVRKPGFDEAVLVVNAVAGETTPVRVALVSATLPVPPDLPPIVAVGGDEKGFVLWSSPWFWTGVGAMVLAGAVGLTVALWPEDEAERPADWTVWGP
ncbi:MAG: PEGA domain-containing protein, partial [Myxococcota bacterium]|nr:PEGA domain-containing protein [Myxococcota bacterium]